MSLTEGLEQFQEKAMAALEMQIANETLDLQNYMRTHYPWQPRTGRAHQSMTAKYTKEHDGFTIALSYGVNYGVYLELAHEKKYALTHPTAKAKGPEVLKEFQSLFDKIDSRFK